MPRADRPIIDGLPRGAKKTDEVIKHLEAVEAGTPIPYFKDADGRLKYFDFKETNPETGEKRYSLIDLTTKLTREAQRTAEQLGLTPNLEMFIKQWGPEIGPGVFLEEMNKLDYEFDNYDTDLYDMDHMGSKRFKYPHLARDINPQLKANNRGEGARQLTPEQEIAFRVVPDDLETTIALQGPELTRQQKDTVMGRINGGATRFISRFTRDPVGAISLGLQQLDTAEMAKDLFLFAADQNNVDMVTEVAKSVPGPAKPITNNGNDLAKRAHDAVSNEIEYVKTNGNGNGIYGSTPSTYGPTYKNGNGGG